MNASRWGLVGLLALAMWLGVRGISFDDLWYDEYRSMWYAGAAHYGPISLAGTWERVSENAVQGPGYYLLLNVWGRAAGDTVFVYRYASLLFGLLALAVVYRAGRDMADELTGLSAAVILAGSAFYVVYLHEMRTYTLVALCSVLTVWLYWRIINGRHNLLTQIGFTLAVMGLPYTHYYAIMTAGAVALYHLIFVPKNREWFRVPLLMLVAVILFLPWVRVLLEGALDIRSDADRVIFALTPWEIVRNVFFEFSNGSPALLALLLILAALMLRGRANRALMFWTVGVFVLAIVVNAWSKSLSQTRYMFMVWPLLALVAGLGVSRLARAHIHPVLPLGVWLVWGVWLGVDPAYVWRVHNADWYFDWTPMLHAMTPHDEPGDHLVIQLPRPTGVFGHAPLVAHYLHGLDMTGEAVDYPVNLREPEYIARVRDAVRDYPRLWVAYRPSLVAFQDHTLFREALQIEDFAHCETYADTPTLNLRLYAHVPESPALRYGDGVGVTHVGTLPATITEPLTLTLVWQIDETVPPNTYSYSLRVEDAGGGLMSQVDNGLPPIGTACTPIDLDLSAVPAGEYSLGLTVYAWESGERLNGNGADENGEVLILGTFTR